MEIDPVTNSNFPREGDEDWDDFEAQGYRAGDHLLSNIPNPRAINAPLQAQQEEAMKSEPPTHLQAENKRDVSAHEQNTTKDAIALRLLTSENDDLKKVIVEM